MITLQQLRDHAAANPDKIFPLGSRTHCLACSLTGKTMAGHDAFEDEERVPPELARFTRGVCSSYGFGEPMPECPNREYPIPGRTIAAALDRIIAGEDPFMVGVETWRAGFESLEALYVA